MKSIIILFILCTLYLVRGDVMGSSSLFFTGAQGITSIAPIYTPLPMLGYEINFQSTVGAIGPLNFTVWVNNNQLYTTTFTGSNSSIILVTRAATFVPNNNFQNNFTVSTTSENITYANNSGINVTMIDYYYDAYLGSLNNGESSSIKRPFVAFNGNHYFVVSVNNTISPQYIQRLNIMLQAPTPGIPFNSLSISSFNTSENVASTSFTKYSNNYNYTVMSINNYVFYLITLSGNLYADKTSAFTITATLTTTNCLLNCTNCNSNGACEINSSNKNIGPSKLPLIIGISLGCSAAVLLIFLGIFRYRKSKLAKSEKEQYTPFLAE